MNFFAFQITVDMFCPWLWGENRMEWHDSWGAEGVRYGSRFPLPTHLVVWGSTVST